VAIANPCVGGRCPPYNLKLNTHPSYPLHPVAISFTGFKQQFVKLWIISLKHHWRDNGTHRSRERQDYFVGGNMFIYYSRRQVRNRDFRGPDFFWS
jgi:hypothetical protein